MFVLFVCNVVACWLGALLSCTVVLLRVVRHPLVQLLAQVIPMGVNRARTKAAKKIIYIYMGGKQKRIRKVNPLQLSEYGIDCLNSWKEMIF